MNITESIKIDNDFIKYNIPLKIEYKSKIFNLSTRDYYYTVQFYLEMSKLKKN